MTPLPPSRRALVALLMPLALPLLAQAPSDSLATGIGGQIGTLLAPGLALVLSFVTRYLTEGFLKIKGLHDRLPSKVKPLVAYGVAVAVTLANNWLAQHNVPLIQDMSWFTSIVIWGAGMGWHQLLKLLGGSKNAT